MTKRKENIMNSIKNKLIEAFNIWWERRKVLKDMERRDYSVI